MNMTTNPFPKVVFTALCMLLASKASAISQVVLFGPDVFTATRHVLTPPLRTIKGIAPVMGLPRVIQHAMRPPAKIFRKPDPVLQTSPGQPLSAVVSLSNNFDGIDDSSQAAQSGQLYAPPDTNGAAGATEFVQWVNYAYAVYDKAGTLLGGPFAGNTLWRYFGSQDPCFINNSGDQIAQYDKAANRWVMMQPVFAKPYGLCLAVSTSNDALGSYNIYQFLAPNNFPDYFPDYPKLGIWPDGYYVSVDLYTGLGAGGSFKGAYVCALDRNAMLNGSQSSTMECFSLGTKYQSLLPADLDGTTAPPANSPNFFMNLGTNANSLNFWRFHADFVNPKPKPTITGPISISVASFAEACGGGSGSGNGSSGGNCIPQAGTSQGLEALGDRLMYRLAYRNFGDHEALVANHSVTAGSGAGVRWYELRTSPVSGVYPPMANATPQVFQSGTFLGDGNFRWMGSIAMDKVGDIAIGYSLSSASTNPSIFISGRTPSDTPAGTLRAEQSIWNGTGSQSIINWGDYSSMSVDPVYDCTFWYTTEYLENSGKYVWRTRVGSFKFNNCPQP